jgi:acetyltransferase-like isoleucine patch superfamily enzyme
MPSDQMGSSPERERRESTFATSARRAAFICAAVLLSICIFGIPLTVTIIALLLAWTQSLAFGIVTSLAVPIVFPFLFAVVAGLLSTPFQPSVRPGVFPRDPADRDYAFRRLYGLCWTSVYYFTPVYSICLSIPLLKRILFRLFGYAGPMQFTIYPDSWIRDLPLLHFENGAYISNKATLGTNIALNDGTILVDRITVGRNAMVGHLSMIAPGVALSDAAEVGAGCSLGLRCKVLERAVIQPSCSISHNVIIGSGAHIGAMSYVASGCRVPTNEIVPPATVLKRRSLV